MGKQLACPRGSVSQFVCIALQPCEAEQPKYQRGAGQSSSLIRTQTCKTAGLQDLEHMMRKTINSDKTRKLVRVLEHLATGSLQRCSADGT